MREADFPGRGFAVQDFCRSSVWFGLSEVVAQAAQRERKNSRRFSVPMAKLFFRVYLARIC